MPVVAGVADGDAGNPYYNSTTTANYIAKWVSGANTSHGLHIDYGKMSLSLPFCLGFAVKVVMHVVRSRHLE